MHSDSAVTQADSTLHTREWRAQLRLDFRKRVDCTVLGRAEHIGPLRVQRPFYPEGDCCHLYILHPPGGLAPGDTLAIEAALAPSTSVLLTTPAAGKIYCSDTQQSPQVQGVRAQLTAGSCLEWLPQETIVFSGAEVTLTNRFDLSGDADLLAWDIVVLGRRASGESFDRGQCRQHIEVYRDDCPLLIERSHFVGGSELLSAPWGMQGASVAGTLVATLNADRALLDSLREGLATLALPGEWGISSRNGVLIARCIGDSPQRCRQGFEWLWSQVRPLLNGREACRPRIWNT